MQKKTNLNIEQQARDLMAKQFRDFFSLIVNFQDFSEELAKGKGEIYQKKNLAIVDLLRLLIIEKLSLALPILENLKLLGIEFPLLETPQKRGKQPAIDIMAYDPNSGIFGLLELKISHSAERETMTELGAYSQGLQNRYHGLSNLQLLWIPISTHWRTTTKSAMAYFLTWQKKLALPLMMGLNWNDADQTTLKSLSLELFNPVNEISDRESRCLFSYECFDAFDYCTMNEIKNRPAFINYLTSTCNNFGINGFVIFHEPVEMMYPYGFTLCIFNPYHGNIHKRMSEYIFKEFGERKYNKSIKKEE